MFLALDWDLGCATIRGIKVHGVGFRCEVGEVRLRALATFDPIGLIKVPYREALWLGSEGGGCCGPVKFNLALYFGDGGLFGLWAELPLAGSPKLALTWRVALWGSAASAPGS